VANPVNDFTAVLNQCRTILQQTIVESNAAGEDAAYVRSVADGLQGFAPLASPQFTGVPTAPTPEAGDNSDTLSTTAYLDRLIGNPSGLATLDESGLVPVAQLPPLALTQVYVVDSEAAMLALDADVGDLAVRTDVNETFILSASPPSVLGNWTQLLFSAPVTSVAGITGAVGATPLTAALIAFVGDSGAGGTKGLVPAPASGDAAAGKVLGAGGGYVVKAGLASPVFTGIPIAPTAAVDTDTGQIASTAFVLAQAGSATPVVDGTGSAGASTRYSRQDHVHPTDSSRAPLNSPAFTGNPEAPTPSLGDNSTSLATTAYVDDTFASGVVSWNSRSGAVVPASGDYAVADVTGAAPLASPNFTGTPQAPTPTGGDNSGKIATTAYVQAELGSYLTTASAASTYAPLASPALTGAPTAPTVVSAMDSTTKVATTAFVQAAIIAGGGGGGGGSPGGSSTSVQFNNSGVFGGDSNFLYDGLGRVSIYNNETSSNAIAVVSTGGDGSIAVNANLTALGTAFYAAVDGDGSRGLGMDLLNDNASGISITGSVSQDANYVELLASDASPLFTVTGDGAVVVNSYTTVTAMMVTAASDDGVAIYGLAVGARGVALATEVIGTDSVGLVVNIQDVSGKGTTIKAAPDQTANLIEVMDFSSSLIFSVGPTGIVTEKQTLFRQSDDGVGGSLTVSAAIYAHWAQVSGPTDITLSDFTVGGVLCSVEIQVVNGGSDTLTWNDTINWAIGDGSYSTTFSDMGVTLQASGSNFVMIWSTDGGTTYYGRAI
jgi:hypothetical protein